MGNEKKLKKIHGLQAEMSEINQKHLDSVQELYAIIENQKMELQKLQDDQHIIFVNNSNENKSFKEENVTQEETIKELQSSITFVENKVKEKEEKLVKSVTALSS